MPDRGIDHLAENHDKASASGDGPEAKKNKAAEKAVAMGQVTEP